MKTITAKELADAVQGRLVGDGELELRSFATLDEAGEDAVTFYANPNYASAFASTRAGLVLVANDVERRVGAYVQCRNPYSAFVTAMELFRSRPSLAAGVHATAVVASDARIAPEAFVGAFCVVESGAVIGARSCLHPRVYVGANCVIGDDCELYPGVVLREDTILGNHVILHANAVIGSDGFGFAHDGGVYRKIPQVGNVVIEDDSEVGANTTIDRAALGETRIGAGTKIDNLVQIAHNVKIGKHCVIAAQAGIAGSTVIGDECRIGGQAGFVGHIRVGNRTAFGAQSGVAADVPDGEIQSGSPARAHSIWKRVEVALPKLPELIRRVRALEQKLSDNPDKKPESNER